MSFCFFSSLTFGKKLKCARWANQTQKNYYQPIFSICCGTQFVNVVFSLSDHLVEYEKQYSYTFASFKIYDVSNKAILSDFILNLVNVTYSH